MMDVGKEKLIWMYMKMLEMRLFEERIWFLGRDPREDHKLCGVRGG